MSRFIGNLVIQPSDDERTGAIYKAFTYESDKLGVSIVIPAGFVTDGASVPRIFWNIIPPFGPYGMAAIVHDYLYRWQRFTKAQSDAVLLEAMWVKDCKWWEMVVIYLAVHLCGRKAWNEDTKKPLTMEELLPNAAVGVSAGPARP